MKPIGDMTRLELAGFVSSAFQTEIQRWSAVEGKADMFKQICAKLKKEA